MTVVTRFAPSPTGFLHIGGARTALYCWLYARKWQGQFILRIEDTDTERSTQESVQAILEAMQWLQLDYDAGPYYQTKRFDRYAAVAEQLVEAGKAYRCDCTKARLENLRTEQMARKEKPRYDGHCRHRTDVNLDSYVIRFRNPETGTVEFDDLIRGKVIFDNAELDDLIIIRSDKTPTYNFTVVIDDWDMHITHVIRGDDHINNTPRQINILKALDAAIPHYAHVPMILGPDGKRLSKRQGAASVMEYRDQGFLPQALLNYLVRLGWSHGDQEIFSREELIHLFDISGINTAPAALNPEKLLWLNQHYIKTSPPQHIASELAWHMQRLGIDITQGPSLVEVIKAQAERVKTIREMAEKSRYFYDGMTLNETAVKKYLTPDILPLLNLIKAKLEHLPVWDESAIHQVITEMSEQMGHPFGKIAQPLRVAVTGDTISPSIDVTLKLLGKDKTIKRLGALKNEIIH